MPAVSILHAPRDEALSEKIAAALARAGHAAKRISADAAVGVRDINASAAIVVWTEAAAKFARLHEQAREAMERGALIPVAVGGARPPGGFESLPPVDLSGWSGALDDPRWRFVLDEIEIARQRTKLGDGGAWSGEEASAEPEDAGAEERTRIETAPRTDAAASPPRAGVADEMRRGAPAPSTPPDERFKKTGPRAQTAEPQRRAARASGRTKPAAPSQATLLDDPFDDPEAVEQGSLDEFSTSDRLVAPRSRPPRQRFRLRDVAIGATFGLVGMTLATAILAPFALPGLNDAPPAPAQRANETPDPSVDEPSRLASLQPAERVSPPVSATADAASREALDQIETAPIEDSPIEQAPADEASALAETSSEEGAAVADTPQTGEAATEENAAATVAPPIAGASPEESLGASGTGAASVAPADAEIESPAEEAEPVDLAALNEEVPGEVETPQQPSIEPQNPTAPEDLAGGDSDAMGNLVASLAVDGVDAAALLNAEAEAAAAAASRPTVDQLPDELKESAYLGNYFKECLACPDMAALPGGSFRMGSPLEESGSHPSEGPARTVTIDHSFAIATREVTFDQWEACVAEGGCRTYNPPDHGWGRGKRPVVSVSHEDAQAFTAWLSNKTGQNYRLPTEAEWEYAARAGQQAAFAYGDRISSQRANYNGKYPYLSEESEFRGQTMPVASFQPNNFGLFDMHGNVWEWTSDCWSETHDGAPEDGGARVAGDCSQRVLKGGAWNTGAWRLRSAHRIGKPAGTREFDNGFRVARDLD